MNGILLSFLYYLYVLVIVIQYSYLLIVDYQTLLSVVNDGMMHTMIDYSIMLDNSQLS